MLTSFIKMCQPKLRLNKLRTFYLSPGHLNPRLSARVIGSKIGEVVEFVVDLVDNGQCGLKKKTVLQTRWSGFFVFMIPFHTSYMYILTRQSCPHSSSLLLAVNHLIGLHDYDLFVILCLKAQPPLWRLDCCVSVHRIGCLHSLSPRHSCLDENWDV